jgi:ketosteroid isomerase-like protein
VRAELQTVAASGDHVFALHRNRGERKGKTVDTKTVLVFKVEKGIVTEVAEFPFDHPAQVRFWS